MQRIEQQQTAGDGVVSHSLDDQRAGFFAFEDDLHHAVETRSVHIHQKLQQLLARGFLRALRHLIELHDQLSELLNLFLKFAVGRHRPPCNASQSVSGNPSPLVLRANLPAPALENPTKTLSRGRRTRHRT